jgi:hypothetical protein
MRSRFFSSREITNSHSRIVETKAETPQSIHVLMDTMDGTQMPAAGLAAIICRITLYTDWKNVTGCPATEAER